MTVRGENNVSFKNLTKLKQIIDILSKGGETYNFKRCLQKEKKKEPQDIVNQNISVTHSKVASLSVITITPQF